jgi:hypothetical protein
MSIFSCKHKYGPITLVQLGGIQYCTKCGKANYIHEHKWEIIDTIQSTHRLTNNLLYKIYTLQCTICGGLKKETITFNKEA